MMRCQCSDDDEKQTGLLEVQTTRRRCSDDQELSARRSGASTGKKRRSGWKPMVMRKEERMECCPLEREGAAGRRRLDSARVL